MMSSNTISILIYHRHRLYWILSMELFKAVLNSNLDRGTRNPDYGPQSLQANVEVVCHIGDDPFLPNPF